MQDYRRLVVWRKAHRLAVLARVSTRRWRRAEYSALRSQLTRAAESIPANIVEGCYATSSKEFGRFLEISIRSSGELEYHLQYARDCGVLSQRTWQQLTAAVREVRRMLVGLRRRVLAITVRID